MKDVDMATFVMRARVKHGLSSSEWNNLPTSGRWEHLTEVMTDEELEELHSESGKGSIRKAAAAAELDRRRTEERWWR